ncbi:MAG: hypothetical protein V1809_12000 [Planctomycetota bacterium]
MNALFENKLLSLRRRLMFRLFLDRLESRLLPLAGILAGGIALYRLAGTAAPLPPAGIAPVVTAWTILLAAAMAAALAAARRAAPSRLRAAKLADDRLTLADRLGSAADPALAGPFLEPLRAEADRLAEDIRPAAVAPITFPPRLGWIPILAAGTCLLAVLPDATFPRHRGRPAGSAAAPAADPALRRLVEKKREETATGGGESWSKLLENLAAAGNKEAALAAVGKAADSAEKEIRSLPKGGNLPTEAATNARDLQAALDAMRSLEAELAKLPDPPPPAGMDAPRNQFAPAVRDTAPEGGDEKQKKKTGPGRGTTDDIYGEARRRESRSVPFLQTIRPTETPGAVAEVEIEKDPASAARAYAEAHARYAGMAEETLLREDVPLGYRDLVRAYFKAIRPADRPNAK